MAVAEALDLLRDPRIFVHTPVVDRRGAPGEFKLRGRAATIEDRGLREAFSDAMEAKIDWRPPEESHFFAVDEIESAAFVTYDEDGTQHVTRWRRERNPGGPGR